jgi:hypothetical protein
MCGITSIIVSFKLYSHDFIVSRIVHIVTFDVGFVPRGLVMFNVSLPPATMTFSKVAYSTTSKYKVRRWDLPLRARTRLLSAQRTHLLAAARQQKAGCCSWATLLRLLSACCILLIYFLAYTLSIYIFLTIVAYVRRRGKHCTSGDFVSTASCEHT